MDVERGLSSGMVVGGLEYESGGVDEHRTDALARFINSHYICGVLGETMHSLSCRYLSVNKPGVWVICGMRFRWNVRPSKRLEISRLQRWIIY